MLPWTRWTIHQIEEKCGLPITLVLDASGSIQSSNAVNKVRDAAEAFLDALSNTNSSVRVTQFATVAEQLAPSTVVDDNSLGTGGALRRAIEGYYNPKPPRPPDVNFFPNGSSNPNNNGNDQYTNWDQSLRQAAETTPVLPSSSTSPTATRRPMTSISRATREAPDRHPTSCSTRTRGVPPSIGPWRRPMGSRATARGCSRSGWAAPSTTAAARVGS